MVSSQRQGLLMKPHGSVSPAAGPGPGLQGRLSLHLSVMSSLDLGTESHGVGYLSLLAMIPEYRDSPNGLECTRRA